MADAPYPADTRAKGWRFELDHERIRQSDTWALAAAEHRPWLLMLWMVAWEQTPCGSLPDDDALIAARIGMAPKTFTKARETLRRGWWKADDGRLYHAGITPHVLRMIDKRAKEAARKAGNRHGSPPSVPRDNTGTDDTRTSTGITEAKASVRGTKKCPQSFELTIDAITFARGLGVDWEAETAKFRDHTFATTATDWLGRWRNWMRKAAENSRGGQTFRERDTAAKTARVVEMTGGLLGARNPLDTIEMEMPRAAQIGNR